MTKNTWKYYGSLASLAEQYNTLLLDARFSSDEERKKRNAEMFDNNSKWLRERATSLFTCFVNNVVQRRKYLTITCRIWNSEEARALLYILEEYNVKVFAYEYSGGLLMETLAYFENYGWHVNGMICHKRVTGTESFGLRITRKQNRNTK